MTALQTKAKVVRKENLSKEIVRLSFDAPEIAAKASPGQFMMIKASENLDPLLRRPFSIHDSTSNGLVQILLKVVGKGSRFLAEREKGDVLNIIGPLGHGFELDARSNDNICLVGGGVGCAPLYFLTKTLLLRRNQNAAGGGRLQIYLGATMANELAGFREDFESMGVNVFVATDDGSLGYRGYVTDLLAESLDRTGAWQFYSCGPFPMMKKVAEICAAEQWPCQVSLETMMACGISACLGCTVRRSAANALNTNQPFLHVCKDGPVFAAGDILWTREDK